ncbi:Lrp/AsnC family transcriptional regulator [Leucobacter sp. CSA2]|uniref:Lrp/AsnC family transcriptional regulator n=1 Tax=Leucobacter edaphi TaxID=2796472 RepID=A0A934QCN6_9MICO|nr:Lrp/AsnC family transcriptional regulator [Leucobacter edaphi]
MPQQTPDGRPLDAIDEKIVWELRREARISNNELAARVNVAPSTALTRLRALRESGVIASTHAQYDMTALGLDLHAIVFIRLKPGAQHSGRDYAERAVKFINVVNVFLMGGSYDLLVHVACTSSSQLQNLVAEKIAADPAVASAQAHIVFEHLIAAQHMDHVDGFPVMRGEREQS